MRARIKQWGVWIVIFSFFALEGAYFLTLFRTADYHVIHVALDDKIPFLPVFVVFYFFWYVYVPIHLIVSARKNRDFFFLQSTTLLVTMLICWLVFLIYPTCIDFIPKVTGNDPFSALCRFLYDIDQPINVFPSMHCANAVAIHLTVCFAGPFRNKRIWHILDTAVCIMICLSTLFIKQHSVLDAVAGIILAVVVFLVVRTLYLRRRKTNHTSKENL